MIVLAVDSAESERDADASGRLKRCPVCGYLLRGLPAAHRCPECAFRYDEHTTVWRPTSFRKHFGTLPTVVAVFAIPVAILKMVLSSPRARGFWTDAEMAIVWTTLLALGIAVFRKGPFVAVAPDGLFMRLHWLGIKHVPWTDVLSVELMKNKHIRMLVRSKRKVLYLTRVVDNSREREALVCAIREALERYRTASHDDGARVVGDGRV